MVASESPHKHLSPEGWTMAILLTAESLNNSYTDSRRPPQDLSSTSSATPTKQHISGRFTKEGSLAVKLNVRKHKTEYLNKLMHFHQPTKHLHSASLSLARTPCIRKRKMGGRSFSYITSKTWKNLPPHMGTSPTLLEFLKKLKTWLLVKHIGDHAPKHMPLELSPTTLAHYKDLFRAKRHNKQHHSGCYVPM